MMYALILIAGLVGLGFGYALGSRRHSAVMPTFSAPDVAKEMSEKGHAEVQARIGRRKERIVAHAKAKGSITNNDVEDLFCISDDTARRYLQELTEERKLEREGIAGGTRYIAVS